MKSKIASIIAVIILIILAILGQYFYNKPEIDINEDLLRVYYFDVGQADCTLIINNGKTMLIDGGNEADGTRIAKYIGELGIKRLDYIIVTHADSDHMAGLDKIIDSMITIGTVYMPYTNTDSKETKELVNSVHNKGKDIETPKINHSFELGKAEVVIKSIRDGRKIGDNKSSIVIEMQYGTKKFLFMGDYEELSNNDKNKYPEEYNEIIWDKVDVLKVAHHGSKTNTMQDFLDKVKPSIAIISAGNNQKYTHPDLEVIDMLKQIGAKTYITKQDGTILIKSDGYTIFEPEFKRLNLDGNK